MKKGARGGIYAAMSVLTYSIALNVFQIWYMYYAYGMMAGYPLPYFSKWGLPSGTVEFHTDFAIYNVLTAIGAATLAAAVGFVLLNARTIVHQIVLWVRWKNKADLRERYKLLGFTLIKKPQPNSLSSRLSATTNPTLPLSIVSSPCQNQAMINGIIGGLYAVVLVLTCSLVVNVYQVVGVYLSLNYSDVAGFPLTCYSRGGIIGLTSFNDNGVINNALIAMGTATLTAAAVFVLLNAPAIMRRMVMRVRR